MSYDTKSWYIWYYSVKFHKSVVNDGFFASESATGGVLSKRVSKRHKCFPLNFGRLLTPPVAMSVVYWYKYLYVSIMLNHVPS